MTPTSEKMESILTRAENDFRDVIAEAARVGDYDTVDLARELAARLRAMLPLLTRLGSETENSSPEIGNQPSHRRERGRAQIEERKVKTGTYPRFVIRKDVLSKFGWSKKGKKEYVHKVPKEMFDQTVVAIRGIWEKGGTPFTAEQIGEQIAAIHDVVPAYQVYVSVAFLRKNRLIQREGRDGYVVLPEFAKRAETLWRDASSATIAP